MPGYADVEDPAAMLAQDAGLSGGSSIEDAISEAGFQVQAVNWVWEQVVGEDLVSSIITPITGDFEKIAKGAAQWNNVRDALQAVRNNLNGGLEELSPHWTGAASEAFAKKIGMTWTLGIEADAQAAKLIGMALSKVADGSRAACDQILNLIEWLVNKLIEAAAMLPIPVVGWGRAVKLVYDGIQLYNKIMDLIDGVQQIIEGAQQVIDGVQQVGTALSKIDDINSLNDFLNVANEAGQGAAAIKEGASSVKEGATQASDAAGGIRDTAASAADNARGLADERSAARDSTSTSSDGSTPDSTGTRTPGNGQSPSTRDNSMAANAGDPNAEGRPKECVPGSGDPVDLATGQMFMGQTDLELPGILPLVLERTHFSSYRVGRYFGRSWASTLDQRIEVGPDAVYFASSDGARLRYPVPAADAVVPETGSQWPLARTDDGYTITQPKLGRTLHFPAGSGRLRLAAITDRNDNRIDVDYNADGVPAALRHSGGYHVGIDSADGLVTGLWLHNPAGDPITVMSFGYNESGQLAEVTNSSGLPMRFEYDHAGRIIQWTDRNGEWYRYNYDADGRVTSSEGSGRALTGTWDYDDENHRRRYTNSLGHTTIYGFNHRWQLVTETDPLGNTTTREWNSYNQLTCVTDALGRTTRYTYDDAGNLTTVIRPDGSQVLAEYNDLGLQTKVTNADGAVWQPEYDPRGNLVAETDPTGARMTYAYDARGRLSGMTDALGQSATLTTNEAGLVLTSTSAVGATTQYIRDVFGRPSAVTDPAGGRTELGWTVEGRLRWRKSRGGGTERWAYDGEGNLTQHVDAEGRATRYELTRFDLPARRIEPDGSHRIFSYDSELRLVAVSNALGQQWRYEYDGAGRLVAETDFDGRTLRYRHDAAGQLVERVNGAGEVTTIKRDALGAVVEQCSGDDVTTYVRDPLGQIVSARNDTAEVSVERDAMGRVIAETCNGMTLRSEYDVLGRRTRRVTASGAESVWEYDAADQPVALHTAGRTVRFSYDTAGREVERDFGAARLTQTWDTFSRLQTQTVTALQHGSPAEAAAALATPLQQRAYHYRPDGYVVGIDDQLAGARRFAVDPVGRITGVQARGWTETYVYDSSGNVMRSQWGAAQTSAPVRSAANVRYRFDAQGRVITRQHKRPSSKPDTWHYTWDGNDRLVGVVTPNGQRWSYRYDPLGRRIAKQRHAADGSIAEEVRFSWDGFNLAEQFDAGTDAVAKCTVWNWEHDRFSPVTQVERVPVRERPQEWVDQQFFGIVADLVGSPAELIDGDGVLAWQARTTVWGADVVPNAAGAAYCPFRFPGQYKDIESGLNYNFHRHYDAETGQYATLDPLGLAPAPNPRTYVHNPMNSLDPLGLAPPCQQAREAAQAKADELQGQHNSKTRPTAAAALVVEGHEPVTGASTKGTVDPTHHPRVQEALDRVPPEQRSPSHGRCAEPSVISDALNSGVDPSGGHMAAVEVRGEGNPVHGTPKPPCSSCAHVLDQFDITAVL